MKYFGFFLSIILFSCGSNQDKEGGSVTVACAANMQYAMDSIALLFEKEKGIKCDITAGSSGMLAAQIESGAPYDLFISADLTYPQGIFEKGNGEKPFIYAKGRLVLVVGKNTNYQTIEEALSDSTMRRVGISDKRLAPYGMAADQYLKKVGLYDKIASRLVVGENIGQINQYLTTGSVDAAFTSYSFRIENEENFKFFEVDPVNFEPIEQGAMILEHGLKENAERSAELRDFLKSVKCKAVLNYFGYHTD